MATIYERVDELEAKTRVLERNLLEIEALHTGLKEVQNRILDLLFRGQESEEGGDPDDDAPRPPPGKDGRDRLRKPSGPVMKFFPEFPIHGSIKERLDIIAGETGRDVNEVVRGILYRALGYKS